MNKILLVAIIAIIAAPAYAEEPTVEEGVYVLDDSNFDAFVAANPNVLAEFYAPWCGHCKTLAPEYAAAATALASNANIKLAKIDATEAKDLAAKFEIKGFPTLKFLKNGKAQDYQGGRTKDAIIAYCQKKSGPVVADVADKAALETLQASAQVLVVYFGEKDSDSYKTFESVAESTDAATFAVAPAAVGAELEPKATTVVLFKKFDEKRNDLETVTADGLTAFIEANSTPSVLLFGEKAIELVFQKQKAALFLFNDDSKDGAAAVDAAFAASGSANKGKIVFSYTKPTDGTGYYNKLAEYVGVDASKTPAVMLVHSHAELEKYVYTGDITEEGLNAFVAKYEAKELKRYLKTAEAPASNDEPVKVIVGTTFDEIVLNNDKDVLVEFYAPWCGHCKTLDPKYTEAAKQLSGNPNVVLAKCDATANEVPGVNIQGFPTLKFYPGNAKTAPVDYDGDRETEGIVKYLKEHATKDWVESAANKDDL